MSTDYTCKFAMIEVWVGSFFILKIFYIGKAQDNSNTSYNSQKFNLCKDAGSVDIS